MANSSNYHADATLEATVGRTGNYGTLASPPSMYIALLSASASKVDTGATISEASYTSYARVQLQNTDLSAISDVGLNRGYTSINELVFPDPGGVDATVLTDYAILDASALGTGNIIWTGSLTTQINGVSPGSPPRLPVGSVQISQETKA